MSQESNKISEVEKERLLGLGDQVIENSLRHEYGQPPATLLPKKRSKWFGSLNRRDAGNILGPSAIFILLTTICYLGAEVLLRLVSP